MSYRKPQDKNISSHWNYVRWEECIVCKMEYRRQSGWYYVENFINYYHLCTSCAPTLKDAQEIFNKKPWITKRPDVPPKAPPKRP